MNLQEKIIYETAIISRRLDQLKEIKVNMKNIQDSNDLMIKEAQKELTGLRNMCQHKFEHSNVNRPYVICKVCGLSEYIRPKL